MFEEIIEIQKKHDIKVVAMIKIIGWSQVIIVEDTNILSLMSPIQLNDIVEFEAFCINIKNQVSSVNVISLFDTPIQSSSNQDNLIKIDFQVNHYKDNGFKLKPSPKKDMDRALSFINNISKPVDQYREDYIKYINKDYK